MSGSQDVSLGDAMTTCVVGAGVVGLACARALARSGREVAVSTGTTATSVVAAADQGSTKDAAGGKHVIHYFRRPGFSRAFVNSTKKRLQQIAGINIKELQTEFCFNIEVQGAVSEKERDELIWLLGETFEPAGIGPLPFLKATGPTDALIEVGPRLNFATAWSTNAVSILRSCGNTKVARLERSRRFLIRVEDGQSLSPEALQLCTAHLHDRMTECVYSETLTSFANGIVPAPVRVVPMMKGGRAALEVINKEMGLSFDDWDLDYYTNLFVEELKRDPTDVECFDMAQSNSEHSRHWFFSGRMVIDGVPMKQTLFQMVKATLEDSNQNSLIAFHDNSSSLRGFEADHLASKNPREPSPLELKRRTRHVLLTAETHNFPTGVAPFAGAETGPGGRIRDVQATGTGAFVVAGTAGYCVGNLHIPGYPLPWEEKGTKYPECLATPLEIVINASNGASDYGNKFGEPVVTGFVRSFGQRLPCGERREWVKPIMFTAGIGQLDDAHVTKGKPEKGMLVIKVGGPAYRIGMGGGAASSQVLDKDRGALDFNAVQRGDAEMGNKMNRVIRGCAEMGEANPIVSIHDQGAGGNGNVLKEIVEPAGARLEVRRVLIGDETLSVLEIWGAEYQENNALLLRPAGLRVFQDLCERERCPFSVLGHVTGDGRCVLHDETDDSNPFDMPLDLVLGKMPQKTFDMKRQHRPRQPLVLPEDLTVAAALDRVLRLLVVGSKRFLTNKVDRSVSGLVAQQQCVGPLHTPLANCAVLAQSHFAFSGSASAIGEQPIKGLVSAAAGARMAVAEALSNLVWARVTCRKDIKCSANWMWPAKCLGDGPLMCDALTAMCAALRALGVGVDGGKDSLSMAARADGEVVKSPGNLVISAYAACPDIRHVVTPDLKRPGATLLLVDLSQGHTRLAGSALAQVFSQVGEEKDVPDLDSPQQFGAAFDVTQSLIKSGFIAAGHDRSDGGLISAVLEMCFAGNCGIAIALPKAKTSPIAALFCEELGFVIEAKAGRAEAIIAAYAEAGVPCTQIGIVLDVPKVRIEVGDQVVLEADMRELRDTWEATSFALEMEQTNPRCVAQEQKAMAGRAGPQFNLTFTPSPTPLAAISNKVRVAILREEGSNGDREMAAAFMAAGMEPWDVAVRDLLEGSARLERFRGVVFVGGFSYADVLDSAKGWAGALKFAAPVWAQLEAFYKRPDTFSLGVCNGCQLMALLGWVPFKGALEQEAQPRFTHNDSGRFESRFSTVRVEKGPSIMLKGMEGSVLGVWLAHGEGRAHFPDAAVLSKVQQQGLVPLRYVDDSNQPTQQYPFNPNGSMDAIAGLCSVDGRHLAIMPHPERCVRLWQWPWMPQEWHSQLKASPWLKMFQNAREWCEAGDKSAEK